MMMEESKGDVQSAVNELREFIESHAPKHTMVAGMQWDYWADARNALDYLVAELAEAQAGWAHMSERYMDVHIEGQQKDERIAELEKQAHASRRNGFIVGDDS